MFITELKKMIDQVYSYNDATIEKWIKKKNKKDINGKIMNQDKSEQWNNLFKAFLIIKKLGKLNDLYLDHIAEYELQIFKYICDYKAMNKDYKIMVKKFGKFLDSY